MHGDVLETREGKQTRLVYVDT